MACALRHPVGDSLSILPTVGDSLIKLPTVGLLPTLSESPTEVEMGETNPLDFAYREHLKHVYLGGRLAWEVSHGSHLKHISRSSSPSILEEI